MSSETIIRLYRHGQSQKNLNPNIVGGRCNGSSLTEVGVEQSRGLGLARARILGSVGALLYSSSAVRALQTGMYARHEAGSYRSIIAVPSFQEVSHGKWEGKNKHEPLILEDGSKEWYKRLRERGLDERLCGSETVREVGERMVRGLAGLACRHSGEEINVFSHAGALRSAAIKLTGNTDYLERKVPFVSETIFIFNGETLRLDEDSFATPTIDEL